MAGAGFKDFSVGEVLTSADVDQYLMQQAVMRFADAAARGSALGTAVGAGTALAEGMVSYLDDLNAVQVYNGTGWTSPLPGIGSNVVQAVKTDTFTTTSTSFTTVTGLSATITPTTNTSKVLIIAQITHSLGDSLGYGHFQVTRDTTEIYRGDAGSGQIRAVFGGGTFNLPSEGMRYATISGSIVYLDSPTTTSATTYNVRVRQATNGTVYINRSANDAGSTSNTRGASSITVIEVAA